MAVGSGMVVGSGAGAQAVTTAVKTTSKDKMTCVRFIIFLLLFKH
jgi:hypothetical protein